MGISSILGFFRVSSLKIPKRGIFWGRGGCKFWGFGEFIPLKPHFLEMGKGIISDSVILGVCHPQIFNPILHGLLEIR